MKKFFKKVGAAAGKIADAADEAIEDFKDDKDEKMSEAVTYLRDNCDPNGLCPVCGSEFHKGEE